MTPASEADRQTAETTRPEREEVSAVAAERGGRVAARARGRAVTSLLSGNAAVVGLAVVVILGVLPVPAFGSLAIFRTVALAAWLGLDGVAMPS